MSHFSSVWELYPKRSRAQWPLWMMRQAGRTLPEYRELRDKADSFIDLVSDPHLVKTITLQPLLRFDCDAAIVFSDILLPLAELPGVKLSFHDKSKPGIQRGTASVSSLLEFIKLKKNLSLYAVCEAISLLKKELSSQELIGFCGGVWTVASYFFGQTSPLKWDQIYLQLKQLSNQERSLWIELFQELLFKTLLAQYEAGATQCMIFDSWAYKIPPEYLTDWVIKPIKSIASRMKIVAPDCPLIYYAKNLETEMLNWDLPVDVLAFGANFSMGSHMPSSYLFQGNCNIDWLFLSDYDREKHIVNWRSQISTPVVVNLGQGLDPLIPLKNIEHFVKMIRQYAK